MSDYERNKGKLIPAGIDTENFTEDDWETYYENGFVQIDDELYTVEWEIKRDTDPIDYWCRLTENRDGSIDFDTYHYNGVACWTEVVEEGLVKKSESTCK